MATWLRRSGSYGSAYEREVAHKHPAVGHPLLRDPASMPSARPGPSVTGVGAQELLGGMPIALSP
jgi:hypothetical protein